MVWSLLLIPDFSWGRSPAVLVFQLLDKPTLSHLNVPALSSLCLNCFLWIFVSGSFYGFRAQLKCVISSERPSLTPLAKAACPSLMPHQSTQGICQMPGFGPSAEETAVNTAGEAHVLLHVLRAL